MAALDQAEVPEGHRAEGGEGGEDLLQEAVALTDDMLGAEQAPEVEVGVEAGSFCTRPGSAPSMAFPGISAKLYTVVNAFNINELDRASPFNNRIWSFPAQQSLRV